MGLICQFLEVVTLPGAKNTFWTRKRMNICSKSLEFLSSCNKRKLVNKHGHNIINLYEDHGSRRKFSAMFCIASWCIIIW